MYMVDSCDIDVERAEGWERECVEERKMQVYEPCTCKTLALYPGAQGGGERASGTHCLRMRLISQVSGKIVYFSNLPCYIDVIFN